MKVLLKQDVKNVGKKGQIVEVKEGYGRNFLLPNGLAVEALGGAVRQVEEEQKAQERRKAREKAEAREAGDRIAATVLTIKHKAGGEGHLFGSVTNAEIAEALAKRGFALDKRQVHLEEPIRFLGRHQVQVKLHPEVVVMLAVVVERAT
jgi:large subunit ribosomal protein L9